MNVIKLNLELIIIFIGLLCPLTVHSTDFYELLGVKKDADAKEIRKAFKNLALTMHPDKNQGDPEAHDKFIEINKAYEVLKDQETRKKYDTYGEEGLKDDFGSGWKGNFHSWNYYYESFGIYDDDPEVSTLSRSDFDRFVDGSDTIWFINYYSPQCSHCHHLAPAWRQLARDLEGVVRIGAVNCEEEWNLCRQLNIRSYPTLMLFPQEVKYQGQRDVEALTEFILGEIGDPYFKLTKNDFKVSLDQAAYVEHPWLVYFCESKKECWDIDEVKKLSIMVDGLVNVGHVECDKEADLCKLLGHSSNEWVLFTDLKENGEHKSKIILEGEGKKEVFNNLLNNIPEPETLNKEKFNEIFKRLKNYDENPHLIYFKSESGETLSKEIKMLKTVIGFVDLEQVDCEEDKQLCQYFHLKKLPAFIIFRNGGEFEIFHGDKTVHGISLFVKETLESKVTTLQPKDFPGKVVHSSGPWFVDFFAPWCPPCMNLLPEWRKASKASDDVSFGTVDCTVHSELCSSYGVKSYPTTILFNQTVPHQFHGRHTASDLLEFIEDTLNPVVVSLTPATFSTLIETKDENVIWAVDFYAPWCGPCQKLGPHWRRMAKALTKETSIKVGEVDCQLHQELCRKNGVSSYPTIRVYPLGSPNNKDFSTFNGWSRDSESLKVWLRGFLPTIAKSLSSNDFFNQVLLSSDPWVIDFFAPWCGHCQVFEPVFEEIAKEFEGSVKAGKVNCDKHASACQQATVRAYPTIRFYPGTKDGKTQIPWGEDIDSQDGDYIINFIKKRLPKEPTKAVKEEL